MNSPLGKYSQLVAAITVLATIVAWGFAVLAGNRAAASDLFPFATLAFGAVLGSAAAINGYKRDQIAIHKRLDEAGVPPAKDGVEA